MSKFGLIPKKSLGQNFLIDKNIARKIIDSLELYRNDLVVEVGPGKGALTQFLINEPIIYIGIELDTNLVLGLQDFRFISRNLYFEIIEQDFLEFSESNLVGKFERRIKLIGNIPYNLTSPILFKVLDNRAFYDEVLLMVQREVANRLIGRPGTKDYGTLSVLFQNFADVKKLFDVSPTCFFPEPKVHSSVITIRFKESLLQYKYYDFLKKMVKLAFNQRRKILQNSLFKRLNLLNQFVSTDPLLYGFSYKRAEELYPSEFTYLVEHIANKYSDYV